MKQHHFEIYVCTEDDQVLPGPELNGENSATWWDGTVWDDDAQVWIEWEDATDDAAKHLTAWLNFPKRVKKIYQQFTDDDGWDIDIMTEIMRELIDLGVVSLDEPIAR